MQLYRRWLSLSVLIVCGGLMGCPRSSPPEIPVYHPPARRVVKEVTAPEPVADAPRTVVAEPPPPPRPPEPTIVASKPASIVEAPPDPKKETPKEPTLIGSWRVSEMAQRGQVMPMPGEMEMTLTFSENGTVTMSMSGGPMPESQSRQGTYRYADGQVTISLDRETKTGRCTFEGTDRVTLEFDDVRMVLRRG